MVQVADLLGLSVAEAQAWADGQGLDLSVSAEFADMSVDSGLAGRVAAQSIAPGAEIASGSSISVSLGVVRVVQIPDVTGLAEAEAMQALTGAGLVGRVDGIVSVNLLSGLGGVIAEQAPAAGADLEQDRPFPCGSVVSN